MQHSQLLYLARRQYMPKILHKIKKNLAEQHKEFNVKLLDQFLLVGLISAIVQFLINLIDSIEVSNFTEVGFGFILGILYILNKKGLFYIARNSTLILINIAVFFTYKLEPTGGVQYYYFPMILLSLVLHDRNEFGRAIAFGALPIFLFFINTYKDFGNEIYLRDRDFISVVINFTTASVVSSIAIIYLIKSNLSSEDSLIEANEEILTVSKELKVNNEILVKTNNELDKFMYSSSHDLRAPLASILGLVNLARLEPIEKHKDYIEMIRDRVVGLDYFIKDIIDFSKNSNTDIRYEIINVQELIDLCVERNKYLPGADKVELSVSIDILRIKSDHYRLSSILTTLIANAVKYHNLDQENPMLWIEVNGSNPVEFSIRDNGSGINKLVRPHIFNMFYRGNEKSNGSGLGLYIAREMLNSLRGTFEVYSEEGKGSTFKFYIPKPS